MDNREHTPKGDYSAEDKAKAAHYCDAIESATLSALLQGISKLDEAAELAPSDFAWTPQQKIFQAMRASGTAELAGLTDYLKSRGKYEEVFTELMNAYNDPAGIAGIQPQWIRTIKACSLRRSLWHTSQQMANLSVRADLDTIEETYLMVNRLETLAEAAAGKDETEEAEEALGVLAASYWNSIEELKEPAETGVPGLDKAIGGGFQPGKVVVLLGPPGAGKTTLANQIAEHVARIGRPVYYVSSEDTPFALLSKTAARLGSLDYTNVLQGRVSQEEIGKAFNKFWDKYSAERLVYRYVVGGFSLAQVQSRAFEHFERFAKAEKTGPGVLVIDYLQRLARFERSLQGMDIREVVTRFAMQLRKVAEALDCTLLALCSMNRNSYNKTPTLEQILSAAKESGDIEYTCDILLGLVQDVENQKVAPKHKMCKLYVAKNRLGEGNATLDLDFNAPFQVFAGVEKNR